MEIKEYIICYRLEENIWIKKKFNDKYLNVKFYDTLKFKL